MGSSNEDNYRSTSNTLYSEKLGYKVQSRLFQNSSLEISKKYIVQYIFSEIKMCLS
jgi:hypothetical protein